MMIETKLRVMRAALTSAVYVTFALAAATLYVVGPKLENLLYPVTTFFTIDDPLIIVDDEGNKRWFISGLMDKERGECEPLDVSFWAGGGVSDPSLTPIRVDFSPDIFHDVEASGLRTRPEGIQHWGMWEIFPPEEPIGPILTVSAIHDCHKLWNVPSTLIMGLTEDIFPALTIDK